MKRKTDLFHLIKAMSKSEKRYFSLDAQKSGRKGARYLDLFRAINGMEAYDEAKLRRQFPKNLPTDKAYLYEAILRSMRDYRSANSHAARIKELILDAKYLYERGLYDQSEERLSIAKSLAYELGDQLSVLELNKEYRQILRDTKKKGYEKELEALILEKNDTIEQLKEEFSYLDTLDKLLFEIRKNPQQRAEPTQQEKLRDQFSNLVEYQGNAPHNIQAKLRFYQCMALLYQLLDNVEQVYYYFSKIVECWDASPKYKSEEFSRYIYDFSNLLHATFSDQTKFHLMPKLLEQLEQERPVSFHDQKVWFQKSTSYRLVYMINIGDFKQVEKLAGNVEKGLKQYDIGRGSEMTISFNLAILLFMAEKFALCEQWSGRMITRTKYAFRKDIQNTARILHLIAVLELDDFDETEHALRNTNRYFQKVAKELAFYKQLVSYVKKLHGDAPTEAKQTLSKMKAYLNDLRTQKVKVPLGLDELLLLWIESRLKRQSIAAIMQSRETLTPD